MARKYKNGKKSGNNDSRKKSNTAARQRYCLKIELLSDLCTSNGGIYNDAVDTEVTCDDVGIPYIPGKTLKGCLRECALEINDWGGSIPIDEIFGRQGQDLNGVEKKSARGTLSIRNAYPENYRKLRKELQEAGNNLIAHPQNVLNSFTYLRTQTEIDSDTGAAKRNSLRTMRVVNSGTIFESEIEIPESQKKDFAKCCKVFHHMGMARTRGLGEVRVTIEDSKTSNSGRKLKVKEGTTTLEYELLLEEPVIIKSVEWQEGRSLDYIEGNKILGLIAQRWTAIGKDFAGLVGTGNEKLRVTNAYLSDGENRLTEVPCAYFSVKDKKGEYRDKLYAPKETDKLQLNALKHSYVHEDVTGTLHRYNVQMEEHYHHSLPEDKSIGRTTSRDDGGVFYQISVIRPGQSFKGRIEGTPAQIKNIAGLFLQEEDIYIGQSRSSEYGKCRLRLSVYEDIRKDVETEHLSVTLVSPAIIYGTNASYSTRLTDLYDEVLTGLGIDSDCVQTDKIKAYSRTTNTGGYNVIWGRRKPTVSAFDKGTVLDIHLNKKIRLQTGTFWIGERTSEGYGECVLEDLSKEKNYVRALIDAEGNPQSDITKVILTKDSLLSGVADNFMHDLILEQASVAAADAKKNLSNDMKAVVGNMILMATAKGSSFESVRQGCEDRFSVQDEGKQKKGEIAKKICADAETAAAALQREFEERYQISGYDFKRIKIRKEYLITYLRQIKYRIRSDEKQKTTAEEETA